MARKTRKYLLNEIEELKKQVNELIERVYDLENMHAKKTKVCHYPSWQPNGVGSLIIPFETGFKYRNRILTQKEISDVSIHPHPTLSMDTVNTNKIKNITFNELAKYVLDGSPIIREEKKEIVYKNEMTTDSFITSIKTDFGNFSFTESV